MSAEMFYSLNEQSKLFQYGKDRTDIEEHLKLQRKFEQQCLERIKELKVGKIIDDSVYRLKIIKIKEIVEQSKKVRIVYYESLSSNNSSGFTKSNYPNTIFIEQIWNKFSRANTLFHELGHLGGDDLQFYDYSRSIWNLYSGFREITGNKINGRLINEYNATSNEIIPTLFSSNEYKELYKLGKTIFKKLENLSYEQIVTIFQKYGYSKKVGNKDENKYVDKFLAEWNKNIWNRKHSKNELLMEIFHNARYVWSDRMMFRDLVNELSDGLFQRWFEGQINLEDIARLQVEVDAIKVGTSFDKSISSNFEKR